MKLEAIEKRKPVPTIHPEFAYVTMSVSERDILCQAVRAAKQVNDHWNQMGSDGDMPVFQYDLLEALSKIEFGGDDET